MAQFVRSLAISAMSAVLGAGGYALARGPDLSLPGFASGPSFFSAPVAPAPEGEDRPPIKHKHGAAFGYGKPVCVRLCDGFFFPTDSVAGGEAACAAQCPDAPTALYTMPTDQIEDAVSVEGKRYSALPVAKRYQTAVEATCACHRDIAASRAKELLHDPTLRKGDVVMTPDGFRVYEGEGYAVSTQRDFVTLSQAHSVPKEERAALSAMERASAGARPSVAPTLVAARPKGNVTVDNGTTPPAQ